MAKAGRYNKSGKKIVSTKTKSVDPTQEIAKKSAQRADEKIIAQSSIPVKKDAKGNVIPPSASLIAEKNKITKEGNASRIEGLPYSPTAPKNPNVEPLDNTTPKVPQEEADPTPRQEAITAGRRRTMGRREKTGNLNFSDLPKKARSPFDAPDATDNRIERMQSGMGLPGAQNGDLDLAIKLHARDLQKAKTTGKVVNGVTPNDSPKTSHNQIISSQHHTAFARVMRVMGVSDEEVYRNAASATGTRLPTYIQGLHSAVQQHEDSKAAPINMDVKSTEHWEHPRTKEIIPVSANHRDMPSAFMRSKGLTTKVTMGADGSEIKVAGHEGWTRMKASDGKSVLRLTSAPTKGVDLVDHLRVQMLDEHGPSKTSRKKGADIATDMADIASGAAPRGMQKSGQRKVAGEGFGTEKYVDTYSPVIRPPSQRAFDKPNAPGVKGLTSRNSGRDTSAIQDGKYLLNIPEIYDQNPTIPDFKSKGPKMVQDKLPGTGVPKYESTEVSPAGYTRVEGPMSKGQTEKIGQRASKNSKPWTEEELAPTLRDDRGKRVVTKQPVITTKTILTDRDDTGQQARDLNRGQQFAIDTTNMTGAQELSALGSAGALVRSEKKAKKTKPMVQPSLFPDFSVKEGRKNAFDRAGAVIQVSDVTKQLQGDAKKRFGAKEESMAVEGGYSDANGAKLKSEAPVQGSRGAKRAEAQSANDEITGKKLN